MRKFWIAANAVVLTALVAGCAGGATSGPEPAAPRTGAPSPTGVSSSSPSANASGTPDPSPSASPAPTTIASAPAASDRAPQVERTILPTTTDVMANDPDLPHYVVNPNPSVAPKNRLFVFLPGTGAFPTLYTDIVNEAAARGFHAIGLEYPNLEKVDYICDFQSADCYGNVHLEVLTGQDSSVQEVVTPSNSVEHRLIALLAYLAKTYPAEGWAQYLSATGDVTWAHVVMSGHSQGSGHAGYLAKKLHAVARLCLFSGPDDWNSVNGTATWAKDATFMTPASAYFGFINTADTVEPTSEVYPVWTALGMGSTPVTVDAATPPYAGSHELYTSLLPADNGDPIGAHDEPVVDISTPVSNGIPVHLPVWDNDCFS